MYVYSWCSEYKSSSKCLLKECLLHQNHGKSEEAYLSQPVRAKMVVTPLVLARQDQRCSNPQARQRPVAFPLPLPRGTLQYMEQAMEQV